MFKHILFLFILLLPLKLISQIDIDSITANNAYGPGEKLVYAIKYGAVKGGEASMTIDIIPSGDTYYYYVRASAVTTGLATNFAKIYDVYESYINISNGYPVKSARNIREGKYSLYNEVLFFRDQNYVWSLNSGKHTIPNNTLDLLSAFYFARRHMFNNNFYSGQTISLTTFFEDKIFPIKIKYKETERVKTKFGKVSCLLFVPVLEVNNPFKKEDDLQVWFSDDGNYIPVKIRMKSKIGVIKAELIDYENLKNPLGVK
ncbi:MAG: DUF3108 domain-containing protein [Bacteroidales bacterium]|nr:DUF3108 domain-containing protein [Bacteroidales bacterium]